MRERRTSERTTADGAQRIFKTIAFEHLARIGKALGSPRRLEILDALCQGPRTVEVLAHLTSQSVASTSHHLQSLRAARLVESEKNGLFVTYRVAGDEVTAFFGALRALAGSLLAEIEQVTNRFLKGHSDLDPVAVSGLIDRIASGEVTLLDVRPAEEFRAGHLPGALSIPLPELGQRLADLPRRREVVAYCRGPFCFMAEDAVALLKAKGFRATRLPDGVAEWRARGRRVTRSTESSKITPRKKRA